MVGFLVKRVFVTLGLSVLGLVLVMGLFQVYQPNGPMLTLTQAYQLVTGKPWGGETSNLEALRARTLAEQRLAKCKSIVCPKAPSNGKFYGIFDVLSGNWFTKSGAPPVKARFEKVGN